MPGCNSGFCNAPVDLGNLAFASQFTGTGFDLSLNNQENFANNKYFKPNLNLGIFWSSNFNKMLGAYAGVSVFNIIKPKDTFFNSDNERSMRFNARTRIIH